MIKLTLPEKPKELTEEKERELVESYKATEKAVWKQKYISDALLAMSYNKCAYSEQRVNTESAYMEIEHFRHKSLYPDLVVRWGNLLPSCKKCNVSKGTWNVESDPIVNPLEDTPSEHLYVKAFRFYKKDSKGQNTIEAVALNDREHFVMPRATIGFGMAGMLEDYFHWIQDADTERKRRNVVDRIKSTLNGCGPSNVYSAVLSTYLLYEVETYKSLKAFLTSNGLWDDELTEIENRLKSIALPPPSED